MEVNWLPTGTGAGTGAGTGTGAAARTPHSTLTARAEKGAVGADGADGAGSAGPEAYLPFVYSSPTEGEEE